MEENKKTNEVENTNKGLNQGEKKKRIKGVTLKRVIITVACVTVIFGGSNIYASTQGYKNIFFMIKDMISSKDTNNRDEILSDKDITISYELIEIVKGIKIQVNRLVIKDNKACLYVQVERTDEEYSERSLQFQVNDENSNKLGEVVRYSSDPIFTAEIWIDNYKNDTKILELKVNRLGTETEELVILKIDLENRKIKVVKDQEESNENDKKKQELDQKESNENYKKKQELEQEELNEYYKKKEAIENYLNLTGAKEGGPLPVLIKLGLVPNEYVILNENVIKIDKYEYTQTNIKYSDFKNSVMNYMTEELFNKEFTSIAFKEKDGILCFLNAGGTGMKFEVEDFIVKGDYYEAQVYQINIDDSKEAYKFNFGIQEYNGKYVISFCEIIESQEEVNNI